MRIIKFPIKFLISNNYNKKKMGNVGSDYYDQDPEILKGEENKFLSVKTMTAGNESLELFDYHSPNPIPKHFTIKSAK